MAHGAHGVEALELLVELVDAGLDRLVVERRAVIAGPSARRDPSDAVE
jgi:hypothetical protein